MQVVFNIDKQHSLDHPIAIALGTFDGIHIGHQMLIQQLMYIQKTFGCSSLVYTFFNNPLELLNPKNAPSRLMTLLEKISKFNKFNIDYLVLNPFDKKLSSMSPQEFIEMLIKSYNVKYIVVGYDFRFGYLGNGDTKLLKKFGEIYGYEVIVIPPLSLDGEIISSSLIRKLINDGNVDKASMYLGTPYSISGKIVHGFGRGRKLGFPTANLKFDVRKVIPKNGIYLTKVMIDGAYHWGMTNVGNNPTFNNNEGLFIETYILNYNNDLYDARIKLEFLKRIRDEIKFSNIEELKNQITKDVQWAKNYIYKFR